MGYHQDGVIAFGDDQIINTHGGNQLLFTAYSSRLLRIIKSMETNGVEATTVLKVSNSSILELCFMEAVHHSRDHMAVFRMM
nr:hypothetical protein [Endozoicomonas sp. YOMI1]